ncbi:huntingtin-interacting protein K-like [Sphaerodactylus townsendi]|uniref:huntingtin-interacting protein K-like n=1 Tax=Sphaerodactylus townsendi TaxID=933632 RepID=UPI0020275678|nr:huntingtin-interacting protein K-like [Sphaerodactylus townsendi]
MAAEGDVELELEAEPNGSASGGDGGRPAEKPRKHDSGAADLERVTDYAEEKEIQSSNLETVRARMRPRGDRAGRPAGGWGWRGASALWGLISLMTLPDEPGLSYPG